MKITLVISSLTVGGAEKVMSAMANYWVAQGEKVTLITLDGEDSDFFALRPEVERVALGVVKPSRNLKEAIIHNVDRLKCLRKALRDSASDVIVSFMNTTNVVTLMAGRGLGAPIVVSERNDPRREKLGRYWVVLLHLLYPFAGAVVVQTESVKQWALGFLRDSAIWIVPNPVDVPDRGELTDSISTVSRYRITALGRLVKAKGFDLLLRAFAQCSPRHPDWSLQILGDGDERGALTALADTLRVKDKVSMPGMVNSPQDILRQSDLFVLSSRFEGFPNVLLEAMACGVPVVSFDCPSGPVEIIRDGIDGVLVPPENVDALAEAMDSLMNDEVERRRLGMSAEEVVHRFSLEEVMSKWTQVIEHVQRERTL